MKKHFTKNINPNRYITVGYARGTFIDSDRKIQFIPLSLIEYLKSENQSQELNCEYEEFILRNNLKVFNGYTTNVKWDNPGFLSTLIIEIVDKNCLYFFKVAFQISRYRLIIFKLKNDINRSLLNRLLFLIKKEIKVNIYVFFTGEIDPESLYKILEIPNISKVFLDSINNRCIEINYSKIFIRKAQVNKSNNFIHIRPNFEFIEENKFFNTYYNKKLIIGKHGEIRNSEFGNKSYGKITLDMSPYRLKKIVESNDFCLLWKVNKEVIDVCNLCELKGVCIDSRIPEKRNDFEWYFKDECNYNPFICKWQWEDGYKSLLECGVISNEKVFSVDHERIKKINQELWGE